jgi:hypothetical protein
MKEEGERGGSAVLGFPQVEHLPMIGERGKGKKILFFIYYSFSLYPRFKNRGFNSVALIFTLLRVL